MDAIQVVCPSGLFPLPVRSSDCSLPAWGAEDAYGPEQHLLGQLQGLNERASRLLATISLSRAQEPDCYQEELQCFTMEALSCIQQTLQQAAAATQPVLLVSSQHTSCFCQLLEQVHLVDVLRREVTVEQAQQQQQQNEPQQGLQGSLSFISCLEQQLQGIHGVDAVLAALVGHCQQVFAAGSKPSTDLTGSGSSSKAEAIDVSCLSSIQEQHSAARALPLLLRLYFTNNSRIETLAAGKPEPLTTKLLERCLSLLATKPVMPGYADLTINLPIVLEDCYQVQEVLAARKLKLPVPSKLLDYKSATKLDQTYGMEAKVLPLLQQHDELCDLLSQLALEVKQAVAVDRDLDPKAFTDAEHLVVGSINYVSAAKNTLLELDAWRLEHNSTIRQWQQKKQKEAQDQYDLCDRFALKDSDVVPFMDVLAAAKGLTGLVTDSSSWLQQLLQVHTVKQLREFAANALPALAKLYPRNKRVQSLLKQICASMQGQQVELQDELYMPSYATSIAGDPAASTPRPATPTAIAGQQPGPIAEGKEGPGFFKQLSSRMSPVKASHQQQRQQGCEQWQEVLQTLELEQQRQQQHVEQQQQLGAEDADPGSEDLAAAEETLREAAAVAAVITEEAASAAAEAVEPQSELCIAAEVQESSQAPAAGLESAAEQASSAAAVPAACAAAAEAAQSANQPCKKKSLLTKLKNSIRGGGSSKGKGRPEPSPVPELCSAPAALTAQARAEYEVLLSEVAAEVGPGELQAAAAAAAAAEEAVEAGWDSSSNYASAAAAAAGSSAVGLRLHGEHPRLVLPEDEEGSFAQLKGDDGASPSLGSLASLNTAFERPPDLPWESSTEGPGDSSQPQSPRSVAVAAAAFESRIAAVSRRSSRLSATACNSNTSPVVPSLGAAGAYSSGAAADLPPLPLQVSEQLAVAVGPTEAAAAFDLVQTAEAAAVDADGNLVAVGSPHSARRFHLFRFKSILQHHEKLSTGVADTSLPEEVLGETVIESQGAAPAEQGPGARIRAALSMRRRASAASAVSAATAAVDDTGLAAEAVETVGLAAAEDDPTAGAGSEAPRQSETAGQTLSRGPSLQGTQGGDVLDAADAPAGASGGADVADQPSKQGRVAGLMSRVMNFRPAPREQQAGGASGQHLRQGFRGLNFTAKLKKAMVDRRQTAAADGAVVLEGLPALTLESPPPLACLVQLRVLLEQLMHEIKAETKKHLVMQLQLAAAAAAGSASAKPDASIARPLRQVKAMVKAVHRMQLVLDYPRQLAAAANLSTLWVSKSYSSFVADEQEQQQPVDSPLAAVEPAAGLNGKAVPQQQQQLDANGPSRASPDTRVLYNLLYEETSEESVGTASQSPAEQQSQAAASCPETPAGPEHAAAGAAAAPATPSSQTAELNSFPAALSASCMRQLKKLPAEVPLFVLHLFWDARILLQRCGLVPKGLQVLRQQEESCMRCYMHRLVPAAYEHFKRIAAHQIVSYELLSSCGARSLQPVQPLYFDALLREPCPVLLQSDYSPLAGVAGVQLVQPSSVSGAVLMHGSSVANRAVEAGRQCASKVQLTAAEQIVQDVQQTLQQLQHELVDQDEQQMREQEEVPEHGSQVALQQSPGAAYFSSKARHGSLASSPEKAAAKLHRKRHGRPKRLAADVAKEDEPAPAVVAGPTPLMLKVEQAQLEKQLLCEQQQLLLQEVLDADASSVVDVRQWLLAGLLASLKKDASALVAYSRTSPASAIVEVQTHAAILQRTHQLLAQYAPLSCSWKELWQKADAADSVRAGQSSLNSATACATAAGVLAMLDTAVYDSEAQVLLPAADSRAAAARAALTRRNLDGVLAEVTAALKPLAGFFGKQHLQALLTLSGPDGQQYLLEQLLSTLEHEQAKLLEQLQQIQQQLPPGLLQLPPAEYCHNAGAVLEFYQQQLADALSNSDSCFTALGSLQRIGNGLALLHLMSMQQSVQAVPVFMQVAPLLGVVGQPLTEAAAAAECFEYEGAPDPPAVHATPAGGVVSRSCVAGLLMPEVEQLTPSDAARQAHEMQVQRELLQEKAWRTEAEEWGQQFDESLIKPGGDLARHRMWQASHFQRLLLGPDAEKVRGPALLLTQNAELRAWQAMERLEYMGPCMQKVRRWASVLQQRLQGLAGEEASQNELKQASTELTSHTMQQGQQQQQQRSWQLDVQEEAPQQQAALQSSLAGEVPAGAVAGIGVRENTLYGTSAPSSPLQPALLSQQQQQQQHCSDVEMQQQAEVKAVAAATQAQDEQQQHEQEQQQQEPQQVQQEQEQASEACLSAGASSITVKYGQLSEACLSAGASSITVKRSSQFSQADSGISVRPYMSYDDEDDIALPTPPSLELDPLPAAVDPGAAVPASLTVKALTGLCLITSEELDVAAATAAVAAASVPSSPRAVAAVAAASVPSSPRAGAVTAGGSMGVSIWEAAGAAAAQISASSVAPSVAKLAFRALPGSVGGHFEMAAEAAEPLRGTSSGTVNSGRTYGLAELVGEVSDAISSARSDVGAAGPGFSSRQVHLQMFGDQREGDGEALLGEVGGVSNPDPADPSSATAAAAALTGSMSSLWELEKLKDKQRSTGGGVMSGGSSLFSSPRSPARSVAGGLEDDCQDDAASESDNDEPDSRRMAMQRPCSPGSPCMSPRRIARQSRLQLSSGGAADSTADQLAEDAGPAGTNSSSSSNTNAVRTAGTSAAAATPCSSSVSPGRVVVPRLGLSKLSPGGTTVLAANAATVKTGCSAPASAPASARLLRSELSQLSQLSARNSRLDSGRQAGCEEQDAVEGSYPALPTDAVNEAMTCNALERVMQENQVLKGELEKVRKDLQAASLALLSGNLYTPRPSERGTLLGSAAEEVAEAVQVVPASQLLSPRRSISSPTSTVLLQEAASLSATGPAAGASCNAASEIAADAGSQDGVGAAAVADSSQPTGADGIVSYLAQSLEAARARRQAQQGAGMGMAAGLVKGAVAPGLSPEPSDIKQEASKLSVRAQQPSPVPADCGTADEESGNSEDCSSDSSSIAGDSSSASSVSNNNPASRKLKLPAAIRETSGSSRFQAAQLPIALSALKFALLLEVAKSEAYGSASGTTGAAVSHPASAAPTPQASPLKRFTKAALSTVTGVAGGADSGGSISTAAVAAEQPVRSGSIAAAAAAGAAPGPDADEVNATPATLAQGAAVAARSRPATFQQNPLGSGRIAGGPYGDGPLLAAAVLLQLTGQSRKHALLDATNRIAHWVEYDAVKCSGPGAAAAAAGSEATDVVVACALQAPGGIAPSAADGIVQPKPCSKKRKEEEAEAEARRKQEQTEQQLLLQCLAAAARQAERVAKDGFSLAEKFAPPAPAHTQRIQVKLHRVDELALAAQRVAAGTAGSGQAAAAGDGTSSSAPAVGAAGVTGFCGGSRSKYSSIGGSISQAGAGPPATPSQEYAVLPIPVRREVVEFRPYVRPWSGLTPSQKPIQSHPALPMPRPRPLLLPNNRADGAAAPAAAVVGKEGRLLPGVGVNANAGLVAAARAVHAKEALLAVMPRTAVYSYSVMSDHNRSGKPDDGYSKAPSTVDLDSMEDTSPRKGGRHNTAAAAAAARLGGRRPAGVSQLAAGQAQGDQPMRGAADGCSGNWAPSPSKSPVRSPTKRQAAAAQAGGLLAALVG